MSAVKTIAARYSFVAMLLAAHFLFASLAAAAPAPITPRMFGAVPGKSTPEEMRRGLQAAIDHAASNRVPLLIPKADVTYQIENPLVLKSGLRMTLNGVIENIRTSSSRLVDGMVVYLGSYHPAYTSKEWANGQVAPRYTIGSPELGNEVTLDPGPNRAAALRAFRPGELVGIASVRHFKGALNFENNHYLLWSRIRSIDPASGRITIEDGIDERFGPGIIFKADNPGTVAADGVPMYLLDDVQIHGTGGFKSNFATFQRTATRNVTVNLGSNIGRYGIGGNAFGNSHFFFDRIVARRKMWDIAGSSYNSTFRFNQLDLLSEGAPRDAGGAINENSRGISIVGGTVTAPVWSSGSLIRIITARNSSIKLSRLIAPEVSGAAILFGVAGGVENRDDGPVSSGNRVEISDAQFGSDLSWFARMISGGVRLERPQLVGRFRGQTRVGAVQVGGIGAVVRGSFESGNINVRNARDYSIDVTLAPRASVVGHGAGSRGNVVLRGAQLR